MKILKLLMITMFGLITGGIIGNLLFSIITGEPIRPNRYIPIHDNRGLGLLEILIIIVLAVIVVSMFVGLVRG